jgi:tRNA(adenine34) deaminase
MKGFEISTGKKLYSSNLMDNADEKFMYEALLEAQKAYAENEVPVGAVLVYQNEIIARGRNHVEKTQDASCHAEMQCIREGARHLGNWRLLETTLYCTLEPCLMCAGALFLARIRTLVWGARDLRHGAGGSLCNVFLMNHPTHHIGVRSGVLEAACGQIMKDFFKDRRDARII